ncbi:LysR family transcriptional regulator [Marinobacterium jannaschii]|uniref:LysR family transcriptional regulator n=1 Tax=Marinobacterium jannaschii TaxID=64970 RepID=UPI000485E328|nr:LysR family transcriptional regulator [Marinobacterium jannaschii]
MYRLNLNLLKALEVLLEQRNVSRAAEELNLTQSAMSRQLGQLREHFSDPLLLREGSGFLLTARAQQLKPKIQIILEQIRSLDEEVGFDPATCYRSFNFACTDYVAQFIFPEVLQHLWRRAPGIDIRYQNLEADWVHRLGQKPLDFVSTMIEDIPENVQGHYLGSDGAVCLMAIDHELAAAAQPSLQQMLQYKFVTVTSGGDKDSFFDQHLMANGLKRRIAYSVPFFCAAFSALASSQLLMVLPEHIANNAAKRYPLITKPLPLPTPENHYQLLWHGIYHQDPAHRWVREQLAELMGNSIYSPR